MEELLGFLGNFWPFIALMVVFYYFFYRPQKKEQERRRMFLDSLKKGDRVVTTGGIHGTVKLVREKHVELEIAPRTIIRVDIACIHRGDVKLREEPTKADAATKSEKGASPVSPKEDEPEVVEEIVEVEVDDPKEVGTEVIEEVVEVDADHHETTGHKK